MRRIGILLTIALLLTFCKTAPEPEPKSEPEPESAPAPAPIAESTFEYDEEDAPPPEIVRNIFTPTIRRQLSGNQIRRIQYYLSDDLTLTRVISEDKSEVSAGKVIVRNGRIVEELIISKDTPGELMEVSSFFLYSGEVEGLGICFEEDNENLDKILFFIPDEESDERYDLMFIDDEDNKVLCGDVEYEASYGEEIPHLMSDIDSQDTSKVESRRATGRVVY
jgi:hypothetical protein